VIAVGQRVFVDSTRERSGSVTLADVTGKVFSTVHLADGIEVEVLAWRPGGAGDTRYRVRGPDGADGWLPAQNLRKALVPLPPPEPEPSAPAPPRIVAGARGRRFGQHFEAGRSPAPASPTPASDATDADPRRRFGQH
jgi:hypothetical protein